MSFSLEMRGKGGEDLLKKYGIQDQLLGIAHNSGETTCPDPYSLSDIRSVIANASYADRLPDAARDAWRIVQGMVRDNLASLQPNHCDSCTCMEEIPRGWEKDVAERVLAVPLDEIYSIRGGW